MLTPKILSHRRSLPLAENRGPVPMAEIGPGLRREAEEGDAGRRSRLEANLTAHGARP